MTKHFFSILIYAALATQPAIAATEAQLAPFESLQKCAKEIELDASGSRAKFLECAKPLFAKETDPQLAERIAFWMASNPIIDKVRLCSPQEAEDSGDHYHSSAIGCFSVLDASMVKSGYIFLLKENDRWKIIDVKY